MPGLLVSVRTLEEALLVLDHAAVIDLKEPARGPLGPTDPELWSAVLDVAPPWIPVSAALGELSDVPVPSSQTASTARRLTYLKVGLAAAPPDWLDRLLRLRDHYHPHRGWIAVAYLDAREANAPDPSDIIAFAVANGCAGLLLDTWNKSSPARLDLSWQARLEPARRAGLQIALAGGLDEPAIRRLAPLAPALFAVRGAACSNGHRIGPIDPTRVQALALAAAGR